MQPELPSIGACAPRCVIAILGKVNWERDQFQACFVPLQIRLVSLFLQLFNLQSHSGKVGIFPRGIWAAVLRWHRRDGLLRIPALTCILLLLTASQFPIVCRCHWNLLPRSSSLAVGGFGGPSASPC